MDINTVIFRSKIKIEMNRKLSMSSLITATSIHSNQKEHEIGKIEVLEVKYNY